MPATTLRTNGWLDRANAALLPSSGAGAAGTRHGSFGTNMRQNAIEYDAAKMEADEERDAAPGYAAPLDDGLYQNESRSI